MHFVTKLLNHLHEGFQRRAILFVEIWGNEAMAISYVLQNVTIVKPSSAPVKLLKVEQNCSLQYLQKLVKNCTTASVTANQQQNRIQQPSNVFHTGRISTNCQNVILVFTSMI